MKMRKRAQLLKRRRARPVTAAELITMPHGAAIEFEPPQMQLELKPADFDADVSSLAEAISRMSDADLDRALAEGKANGLYETFRRLKPADFDADYARFQSPEFAKLAREAERTMPAPRFRKFGKPRDER